MSSFRSTCSLLQICSSGQLNFSGWSKRHFFAHLSKFFSSKYWWGIQVDVPTTPKVWLFHLPRRTESSNNDMLYVLMFSFKIMLLLSLMIKFIWKLWSSYAAFFFYLFFFKSAVLKHKFDLIWFYLHQNPTKTKLILLKISIYLTKSEPN